MSGQLLPYPKFKAVDSSGVPYSGSKVYTYEAGTSTLKASYSDYALSAANANPVILDSNGEAPIYLKGKYKLTLYTSADVLVWTLDNVMGMGYWEEGVNYCDYSNADQGAAGNGYSLKDLVDSIGSKKATIVLPHNSGSATTTYTLSTSLEIPANVHLKIPRGSLVSIAGYEFLTINGTMEEVDYQIFTGAGDVVFSYRLGIPVNPRWWADIGNGEVATTAFQKAINTKLKMKWPIGYFQIDDTLLFPDIGTTDFTGIIEGSGAAAIASIRNGSVKGATVLYTPATFAKPLFKSVGGRNLVFRDMALIGPAKGYSGAIAVHFDTLNSLFEFHNITVYGWETAFQSSTSDGDQGNDSEINFFNVRIFETTYCTRLYNSQSYSWHFYGCLFDTTTDYACKSEVTASYRGNKIRIHGGAIGSKVAVFDAIGSFYGMATVEGAHFESGVGPTDDPPTIYNGGTSASDATNAIVLIGNEFSYWNCKKTTTIPFIQSFGKGPIVMIGNYIAHPNPRINVQGPLTLQSNNWSYQPVIYESDNLWIVPNFSSENEYYTYYNGVGGDAVEHAQKAYPLTRNGFFETFGTAAPTTGTWRQGSKIWKTDVTVGGSPGWICTSSGTFSDATDNTGDTDGSTNVITGLTDTSDFHVGDFITVSAGFGVLIVQILSKTANTITVNLNSILAQENITVSTPDPVFKAMANLAA